MKRTQVYSLIREGQYEEAIKLLSLEVSEPSPIDGPSAVFALLKAHCFDKQESFFVATLNGAHRPIEVHTVTTGLLNRTIVHPREVFRCAILDNSAAIIVAHNHPSGLTEPSSEDREITARLKEAGHIIGIEVLDHLILGRIKGAPTFTSMVEIGSF